MPMYPGLVTGKIDARTTADKMRAQRSVGVPYSAQDIQDATKNEAEQASAIAGDLKSQGVDVDPESEMVALIAFLQRLGVHAEPKLPSGGSNVSMTDVSR
jgi:cytochrome c oxidase cbb3-type subunit I/II